MTSEHIAIITARGGSKRVPRKNIRDFCGQPMIAHTIAIAQQSGCFDRIVVSTEDAEIADVARACGAELPFVRDAHLADDHTGTAAVMLDAIRQLDALGIIGSAYCCLYPTTPLLLPTDLAEGRCQLDASNASYVFSVGDYGHPIQRALRRDAQGQVSPFQPGNMSKRSQDLEPAYHDAGQFYWGKREAWISGSSVFSGEAIGYVLPRHRLVDIDTEEDWRLAEALYRVMTHHV